MLSGTWPLPDMTGMVYKVRSLVLCPSPVRPHTHQRNSNSLQNFLNFTELDFTLL